MENKVNYKEVFEKDWKEHVYTDGVLDEDKVARELSDCTFIIDQYKKVMEAVTQGKVSKIFTYARPIIEVHDKCFIGREMMIDDISNYANESGMVKLSDVIEYLK